MAVDNKKNTIDVRQRRYLGRDFESFRATLLDYARQYYPNKIQDFSESSVGGLFLDMASYVGDNLSFYLDHLYGELNYETAVETSSIENALNLANIPINGAAASTVNVSVYVEVPVENDGDVSPNVNLLPVIKSGTKFLSNAGVEFTLLEDIEFAYDELKNGNYILHPKAVKIVNKVNSAGQATSYVLVHKGICTSASERTDTFKIGDFIPFRRLTLTQTNVTEIVKVYDDFGNDYYEVGALTNDVVYKNVLNKSYDSALVKDGLKVIPAPYRFIKRTKLEDRKTILTFGGGNANTLEDDIIPDPSEFAISFPYSKTFSRVSVNPEKLLTTNTLGVSAADTTVTVIYRYGGGLYHNVGPGSITSVSNLIIEFPRNPVNYDVNRIRNTIEVLNDEFASGGEDALTIDELAALIPTVKGSQERIVTKEDLLARVYTMPSNLGRVFRAAIVNSPTNPLATQLYIASRDANGFLIPSSDTLKSNIKKYLNSYRMISDSIEILDSQVVNLQLKFSVITDPSLNKSTVLTEVLRKLQNKFSLSKMYIDQPIIISEVVNLIFTVQGIIAVDDVMFTNISNITNNRVYSDVIHDVKAYTKRQFVFPPSGGIFEIRYPDVDIIAKVVT
jgi:hypothetical protein